VKENAPAGEIELESHDELDLELSADAIHRIVSAVDLGKPVSTSLLQVAAQAYRTEQDASARSTGRGTKADLRRLKAKIVAAADELARTRLQVSLMVGINWSIRNPGASGPSGIRRIRELTSELRWFADAIADAEQSLRGPTADLDIGMMLALTLLVEAYEKAAARPPTHSTHRDGEYLGVPLSPFGRLVVAFFRETDSTLTETQVSSAIRKHLSAHRRDHAPKQESR